MTEIPMFIIDELEIGKRKLRLDKSREFIKHRLCPVADKDDELVDVPSHTASWDLRVVAFELCFLMLGLCFEILIPNP